MSLRRRDTFIASLLSTSIFLLGCEPQKVMKDYFGAQGLNPLAVLRSDVGAVCPDTEAEGKDHFR